MTTSDIYRIGPLKAIILFIVIDVFCMGVGMGVPIFNIAFGFVVGWFLVKWISAGPAGSTDILERLLIYSGASAGITFLGMLLLWGWWATSVYEAQAEFARTGIPMILFEPRASFVAWLVLMIVVSPVLQLLTTTFAGLLGLISLNRHKRVIQGQTSTLP